MPLQGFARGGQDPRPAVGPLAGAGGALLAHRQSALSVAGLVFFVWAIIEAPVHGWTSARVLSSGGMGVLVLAAFVTWEHRSAHPMLELGVFR